MPTTIKLDELIPNRRNPRKIADVAFRRLCESIKRDPQFMELRPIVVDQANVIIGGNQRYRACKHLGMQTIPANWVKVAVNLTEEQRNRFVLIDNAPEGMAGEWDFNILMSDWTMPELEVLGIDAVDLTEAEPVVIKDKPIRTPPKVAWVLVGVPLERWPDIATLVETAGLINNSIVETTINDGINKDR